MADFSIETMEGSGWWSQSAKRKKQNHEWRILYPEKNPFEWRQIKALQGKQR